MKIMIRSNQSITEYPLYHGTNEHNLLEILESNELRAGISNETETYGVSFTRNSRESYGSVDIVVDRYELMNNYHLEPIYRDGIAGRDLAEERCNRTIKDIRKYIKQVRVTSPFTLRYLKRIAPKYGRLLVDSDKLPADGKRRSPIINEYYYLYSVIELCRQYNISMNPELIKVSNILDDIVATG